MNMLRFIFIERRLTWAYNFMPYANEAAFEYG